MVEVLSGYAIPTAKIADVLGVTLPTLFKYYRRELDIGAAKVEATMVGNLMRMAKGSDGTALKATIFTLTTRFGWSQYAPPPVEPKVKPLGKKEQADVDAEEAHLESDWSELVH